MPEVDDDLSANAWKRAVFAQRQDEELPAPWQMRATGSKIGVLAGIEVAVAIVVAIAAYFLAG